MGRILSVAIFSVFALMVTQVNAENKSVPGLTESAKFIFPPVDVTGTVTDVRNAPLAGATVTIKGTRNSVVISLKKFQRNQQGR